jgi:hypothetical protein
MATGLGAVVEGGEGVETARGIVAAHQCPTRWGLEGTREAGGGGTGVLWPAAAREKRGQRG